MYVPPLSFKSCTYGHDCVLWQGCWKPVVMAGENPVRRQQSQVSTLIWVCIFSGKHEPLQQRGICVSGPLLLRLMFHDTFQNADTKWSIRHRRIDRLEFRPFSCTFLGVTCSISGRFRQSKILAYRTLETLLLACFWGFSVAPEGDIFKD